MFVGSEQTLSDTNLPDRYTASTAFFDALAELGVTHCFVNLGTDHTALLEAMVRGKRQRAQSFPQIFTCPNEMVALSMADGFARLTNRPQCVIVHVDVGTQGLGAAVHNASAGRAPVLIFAGLSPHTTQGELRGSRTEYIHWIQDVPDQKAIVAQYCRWVGEAKSGRNIKDLVGRALQVAVSDSRGPVYLCATREVLEEELPVSDEKLNPEHWSPIIPSALPDTAIPLISKAIAEAERPLLITGYSGRNHQCPELLVKLADIHGNLEILDTGGSDMCFPASHAASLGLRYGSHPSIAEADVILVLDCDVPWVPTACSPRKDAVIFHIDVDPLKAQIPTFYIPASHRYRADAATALEQLVTWKPTPEQAAGDLKERKQSDKKAAREARYQQRLEQVDSLIKAPFSPHSPCTVPYLTHLLRSALPEDTIYAIEAVTNTILLADALRPHLPGTWLNCGGGGLGWSGGASLGIKLAAGPDRTVVNILGDGTFLFSVPSSAAWIAAHYHLPVLTVVLNNGGWNAPRRSAVLVHPDGLSKGATAEELNIGIESPTPDFGGIAKAASDGWCWAGRVENWEEAEARVREAVEVVKGGRGAVLDVRVAPYQ